MRKERETISEKVSNLQFVFDCNLTAKMWDFCLLVKQLVSSISHRLFSVSSCSTSVQKISDQYVDILCQNCVTFCGPSKAFGRRIKGHFGGEFKTNLANCHFSKGFETHIDWSMAILAAYLRPTCHPIKDGHFQPDFDLTKSHFIRKFKTELTTNQRPFWS